jgi:hypothetical protein
MKQRSNEIRRKRGVDDRKQNVAKQDIHWPQTGDVGGEEQNTVLTNNLQRGKCKGLSFAWVFLKINGTEIIKLMLPSVVMFCVL